MYKNLFLHSCKKIYKSYIHQNQYGSPVGNPYVQLVETHPIYFNTNYYSEIKLVPIILDYCLLQFDTLKFFLGVRLHGGNLPIFNFFLN